MIKASGLIKLGFMPGKDFSLQNDGDGVYIKEWNSDQPQPSEADITTAHNEWQAEYDALQYQRDRAVSFPTWQEQMDMQYWDQVNGTTTWKDAIAKVKSDNPKE